MVNGITLFTRGHKWIIYCGETPKNAPLSLQHVHNVGRRLTQLSEIRPPQRQKGRQLLAVHNRLMTNRLGIADLMYHNAHTAFLLLLPYGRWRREPEPRLRAQRLPN